MTPLTTWQWWRQTPCGPWWWRPDCAAWVWSARPIFTAPKLKRQFEKSKDADVVVILREDGTASLRFNPTGRQQDVDLRDPDWPQKVLRVLRCGLFGPE